MRKRFNGINGINGIDGLDGLDGFDERDEASGQAGSEDVALAPRDRVRDGLEKRGLEGALCDAVSSQLEERAATTDPAELDALLDGVAAAMGVEHVARHELTRSLGELDELERLMSSFVGELAKLDEALEVLAAYLKRMRSNSGRPAQRLLH